MRTARFCGSGEGMVLEGGMVPGCVKVVGWVVWSWRVWSQGIYGPRRGTVLRGYDPGGYGPGEGVRLGGGGCFMVPGR